MLIKRGMMAKVCIVGKEEVKGANAIPVKEDIFINTIRSIKEFFKIAAGNELVVCLDHVEEAAKKRKEFESSIIKVVALVSVLAVIAVIISILNGNFSAVISSLLLVVLLGLLLVIISLFKYYPAVDFESSKLGMKVKKELELKEKKEKEQKGKKVEKAETAQKNKK
jgi:hypothetical protein